MVIQSPPVLNQIYYTPNGYEICSIDTDEPSNAADIYIDYITAALLYINTMAYFWSAACFKQHLLLL